MQWFKHDTNATMDFKIKKLLIRYGAVGYAIYFHCLELIADSVNVNNITFELEHDSEIIADDLRIKGTAEKSGKELVEEIMRYMVELNLFQERNNHIFCFKLLKRLDSSMTSNPALRNMISKAKQLNHDGVMTPSENVMQEQNRIDKIRQEEKREEQNTQESEPAYIPKITTENYQNLQTECFNLISEHNKSGVKKLAVSRDLFSFAQKEGRELVQLANIESPENIIKALKNYLSVLSVDTWKTYFSFSEFVKKYTEYLPEYFNIQNYIKSVKNPDELADAFYAEMMKDIDNNNFDVALFYEHKQEWLDRGRPKGKAYFELQNEWYKQGGIND